MTLIVIKKKRVYDLPSLLRVVLRTIYEPEKVPGFETDLMMSSIVDWKKHLDLKRETGFSALDEENQIALEAIGSLLKRNHDGEFEKRKELFKRRGIEWRKFHRLPEAFVPADFHRAKYHHSLLPKEEQ